MIPTPAVGVRFDIDRLGGGAYGLEAWKIFWKAVPRRVIAGALLYEGDTNATLSGAERVFVIAVHHSDVTALQRVAGALNTSREYQAVAGSPDLSWNETVASEPLPEAGRLDGRGALIGGFWAKTALDAVKGGEAAEPDVAPEMPPGPAVCLNCNSPVVAGDAFCGVCGTALTAAPAPTILPSPAAARPSAAPPVWVWLVIGAAVLLLIGGGAFLFLRGRDRASQSGGELAPRTPAVGPAPAGGFRPVAGTYTGPDPGEFQLILVVFEQDSSVIDFLVQTCSPAEQVAFPFTIDTDVPISGGSFSTVTSTLEVTGRFTSPARVEGTVRVIAPEAVEGCGVEPEQDWTAVCTLGARRTDDGGFEFEDAGSGACASGGGSRPPDNPVRAPDGPPLGTVETGAGPMLIEGFRLARDFPSGCSDARGDSNLCTVSPEGEVLGIVTMRREEGGTLLDLFPSLTPDLGESFLRSPEGDQAGFNGLMPSQDLVRIDVLYGFVDADGSEVQTLNWPQDQELVLHP
ncbi:MAG: hypothetical protein ACRDI1_08665 [Actinomycetota bacterium]